MSQPDDWLRGSRAAELAGAARIARRDHHEAVASGTWLGAVIAE